MIATRSKPRETTWLNRLSIGRLTFVGAVLLLLFFLVLPLVAVVLRALPLRAEGWLSASTFDALRLSLFTATISAAFAMVVGTPIAYALARENFRGKPAGLEAQVKLAALDWSAGRRDEAEATWLATRFAGNFV